MPVIPGDPLPPLAVRANLTQQLECLRAAFEALDQVE